MMETASFQLPTLGGPPSLSAHAHWVLCPHSPRLAGFAHFYPRLSHVDGCASIFSSAAGHVGGKRKHHLLLFIRDRMEPDLVARERETAGAGLSIL